MTEQLKSIHAVWNQTTGQELNFRATERLFYEMFKMDFTADDLLCVLKHVMGYNRTHPNAQMKVQAHKLLGDLTVFGSILAEARARERNRIPKPTEKEKTLTAWRGCEPVSVVNAKKISEFLRMPQT